MRSPRFGPPLALLATAALAATGARPAAAAEGIAVELAGATSDASGGGAARVITALEALGYLGGSDLARRLLLVHSRSAGAASSEEVENARTDVKRAYQALLRGHLDEAARGARRGVDALLASPTAVARAQELRDDLHLAYVTLALAEHERNNPERAAEAMQAMVREFPGQEPSPGRFGPTVSELYRAARSEIAARGTGNLVLTVDDPDAMIFINERLAGTGSVSETLPAGSHRIYLQRGAAAGRVREVSVHPGRSRTVELSWALEQALEIEPARVLLRAPDGEPRAAIPIAAELGRQLGLRRLIVIGEDRERRNLVGIAIRVEGAVIERGASIPLAGDDTHGGAADVDEEAAQALARFLARGEQGAGLAIFAGPGAAVAGSGRSGVPGALLGVGAGGVVAGIALVGIGLARTCDSDGASPSACLPGPGALEIGAATLGIGAAALAAGLYLWRRDRDRERESRPQLTPLATPGGAGVGLSIPF